ncbi:MAG: hypothetical protein WCN95_06800 [bacterium]
MTNRGWAQSVKRLFAVGLFVCMFSWKVADGGELTLSQSPGIWTIANRLVQLTLSQTNGAWVEKYGSAGSGGFEVLAEASSSMSGPDAMVNPQLTGINLVTQHPDRVTVKLTGTHGSYELAKTITLDVNEPRFHCVMEVTATQTVKLEYLKSEYIFSDGKFMGETQKYDFIFGPHLRPEPMDTIDEHTFRSPVVAVQNGPVFAAIIPDLTLMNDGSVHMRCLELDVKKNRSGPVIGFGLTLSRPREHTYFEHIPSLTIGMSQGAQLRYGYFVHINSQAPPRWGIREVVRFLWAQHGHSAFQNFRKTGYSAALDDQAITSFDRGLSTGWLSHKMGGETVGGFNTANKFGGPTFTQWTQDLRTGYGMYLWGEALGKDEWKTKAVQQLAAVFQAPRKKGFFPCVVRKDGTWQADLAFAGKGDKAYSTYHQSWTCYWLLQWKKYLLPDDERILPFCTSYADSLIQAQLPSGAFPAWIDVASLSNVNDLAESAMTAGSARFLAELSGVTRNPKYLSAATSAAAFIEREVLPQHKWFDFETFYSCSPKVPGFFDGNTGQQPQNTLSMQSAADMFLCLHKLSGDPKYKELALGMVDYLCLYQQVWSPKWMSINAFGGFGAQNCDGEWSDARQSIFACTLADFYDITGEPEYLERAIAAAWATFPLGDNENWAHWGDGKSGGGSTGMNWGFGSALVSCRMLIDRYGGIHVNGAVSQGFGVDAVAVEKVVVTPVAIDLTVHQAIPACELKATTLKCRNLPAGRNYAVRLNGRAAGMFSSAALLKGVQVNLP